MLTVSNPAGAGARPSDNFSVSFVSPRTGDWLERPGAQPDRGARTSRRRPCRISHAMTARAGRIDHQAETRHIAELGSSTSDGPAATSISAADNTLTSSGPSLLGSAARRWCSSSACVPRKDAMARPLLLRSRSPAQPLSVRQPTHPRLPNPRRPGWLARASFWVTALYCGLALFGPLVVLANLA